MTSLLAQASAFFGGRAPVYRDWRRHLHQNPEIAFEERDTAAFLAARLREMGLPVKEGFAGTGLVASLQGNKAGPDIGFRSDMDALPLTEQSSVPYRSIRPGATHACGHDGHMTMLLAAADYLSRQSDLAGTLHFIFQPAEEAAGGGKAMVEDGLFDHAPCDLVFGLHNWPALEKGRIAVQPGPMMAAMDLFTITISGEGVHAALPHLGSDTIVAAGALTQALQAVVSRAIDPHRQLVLSITQIHGGHSLNASAHAGNRRRHRYSAWCRDRTRYPHTISGDHQQSRGSDHHAAGSLPVILRWRCGHAVLTEHGLGGFCFHARGPQRRLCVDR
jgi:hippurate hydrolase